MLKFLKKLFISYIWLGLVIVLVSIIVDLSNTNTPRPIFLSITIETLKTIGIAILISSIFTWIAGTSSFITKIQRLLETIVVKRNFLSNIDSDGKREALKSLIQPTVSEKNKYPNIGDYYGHFINKTLSIGTRSVRSNYQVSSRCYLDSSNQRIVSESIYSYRLYPSESGFQPIQLGFHEEANGLSTCEYISVSDPLGNRKIEKDLKLTAEVNDGDILKKTEFDIQEFGKGKNHLDVEIKAIEYGKDHWSLIQFKALQPTDGFKFQLRCEDDLTVKEHAIFVVGAKYYINQSVDNKAINVTCNQWINEGSGLCVVVSASCPGTN